MLTGIVILLFLALIVSQPFSVIGVSQVSVGDDGYPYWLIQADGRNIGGEYVFTAVANELEEYPSSQGNIVPQEDIKITIKEQQTICVYTLAQGSDDRLEDNFYQLFGSDAYYKPINPNEKTEVFMTFVDDISNKEQTIDALNWVDGNKVSFTHNGGKITIEPLGGFSGNYKCPQLSQYTAVLDRSDTTKVSFVELERSFFSYFTGFDWVDKTQEVTNTLGMICSPQIGTDGVTTGSINCYIGGDNTKTVISSINPTINIIADAKYLDFKYYPNTIGEPKIIDIMTPDSLNAGEVSSINVKVQNIGENAGNFKVILKSPSMSVLTSSIGIKLNSNEQDVVSFPIVAPSGQTKDIVSSCDVTMCSIGEFNQQPICVTYDDCSIDVKKQTTIIEPSPSSCGNGICDVNENYATCPSDCISPIVCDGLNMHKENNKCVCDTGFEMSEDKYGNEYCSQIEVENNLVIYGVLAFILVILVVMIIIAKRKK